MTDEVTEPKGQEAPQETETEEQQVPAPQEGEEQEATPSDGEQEGEDKDPSPEQKQIKQLRGEAAEWRVKYRDLQKQLESAKTPEEFADAVKGYQDQVANLEHQILVSRVAAKYELPEDLASRLSGSTEEELDEDAKKLARFVVNTTPAGDPSGGLNPLDGEDDFSRLSPTEKAARVRKKRAAF